MRGHQSSDAEACPVASQRRLKTPWLVRGAIAATALVTLTASSSSPPLEVAGRRAAFADAPMFTRLRTPGMGWSGRGGYGWPRQARCAASPRMVARGTPEKGEVRNPWGRAGKPETRIMRQQEAEQVAELRAQAWSQALRRSPGAKGRSANTGDGEVNADGLDVSITEDIKDFHERACSLLRENGGRMNSLTFTYKWEQHYGESLVTFLSRQRLTVAEMLKQSNAFWVVDMPGEADGARQMQVYILNEKALRQESARETLGEQLAAVGSSETIDEWRTMRRQGSSRMDNLEEEVLTPSLGMELVGMPEGEDGSGLHHFSNPGNGLPSSALFLDDGDTEAGVMRQVECMKMPSGLDQHQRLAPLLDALEPCLAEGFQQRGLRQMHLAWTPTKNCTCAKSSVLALQHLGRLRAQAKGRQVRRLEEQVKCFAEVVQSGLPTLGFTDIATVLEVIQNRSGYDTLLLFVANRIVQGGMNLAVEAQTCTPQTVSMLLKCLRASGQNDMLLYRQLSSLVQLIPHDRFDLGSLAAVMEGFLDANVRDPSLVRFVGAVLQRLDLSRASAEDVAAMLSALSKMPQDEVSFRRLSRAVLALPDDAFTLEPTGIILDAFASARLRDLSLFRKLSAVVLRQEPTAFAAADIMRVVSAAAAFGSDAQAKRLMVYMDTALLALPDKNLSPEQIGRIALAYAEVGGPNDRQVLQRLSAAAMTLEPWALDIASISYIVKAFSMLNQWDQALFARMSTVLQQADVELYSLGSVATIVQAYVHAEVRDKTLLGNLANVLQQMEGQVFASTDAVQEVSVILNAYAKVDMNDLALALSQSLTNHLKPHVGGVTAQAMLNIIRRGVRSTQKSNQYVGGVREALEMSRLEEDEGVTYSNSPYGAGYLSPGFMEESRLHDDDDERGRDAEGGTPSQHEEFSDLNDDLDLEMRPLHGLGRALVPFSQEDKSSVSTRKKRKDSAMPLSAG